MAPSRTRLHTGTIQIHCAIPERRYRPVNPIDPALSTALTDRYRLERELGAGGMATVYLAEDLRHRRPVAIKVLRPELAAALGAERFLREITTTANLRHPNILPLFDSGERDGFLFYVMPYIEGQSLRDRLERDTQLPAEVAMRIADEIADALGYAHGRGVIHRDIKPENIMLENGHAIVADFGIAHALNDGGSERLTAVGMSLGTPLYMSPEQSSGDVIDARSDLYALGCVAYEMLVGSPPFVGPNAMAIMARHALDAVPSILTVRPNVSGAFSAAIVRALAKVPADRFATMQEWRDAINSKAPSADATTVSAVAIIRDGDIRKPPPTPSTPLLGRDDLAQAALERLGSGARVLTVTGYGGTGKTRFAIELYDRLESQFADGAAFVSLASITNAAEVASAIASALDIGEARGRTAIDALCTVIGKRRMLLVLDNLEQVLESAGDIATLVSRCAGLTVVATSRARLKIGAETEFALPPLDVPGPEVVSVSALMQSPSVALFVQRAQKVKPGFELTSANAVAVVAICRKLDGLPLALELAAARARILEPAALLQRLDHALDLLTSGDRDLPLRQRTLRATISWSYSLLDAREQQLLRRASVFQDGWTMEGMEQVCYATDNCYLALDELDSLVEKGLVRVIGAGERYALLETIRAFGTEQLHAAGETAALRTAHAGYCVAFAADVSAGIKSDRQLESMRRARAESANTVAAVQWLGSCARAGDVDALEQGLLLCGHLNWPWHIAGLHITARELVDVFLPLAADRPPSLGRALALWTSCMVTTTTADLERGYHEIAAALADAHLVASDAVIAECYIGQGYTCLSIGRFDEAFAALDQAHARSVNARAEFVQALALTMKGLLTFITGDVDGGVALAEAGQRISVRLNDCEGGGVGLSLLAQMRLAKGDVARAIELFHEALAKLEAVGDKPEIARVRCELGWTALAAGDEAQARRAFIGAVHTYEEVGSARGTGLALLGLAAVDVADGRDERAVIIATAADALSSRAGVVIEHPTDPGLKDRINAIKERIPRDRLAGIQSTASVLSAAEVLAMVGG